MKETIWSAGLNYANPLDLAATVSVLEEAGCDELHLDIKDGSFVPEFGMSLETIRALSRATDVPLHAHLQIDKPERFIDAVIEAGCTRVTIHIESTIHSHRALQMILNAGARAGIAVKPATPLTTLEYALPYVDFVHVITEDRGIARRVPLAGTFDRIIIVRDNLDYLESRATLVAEGLMTTKHAALCLKHGADAIVMDDAVVFADENIAANIELFKAQVGDELAVL